MDVGPFVDMVCRQLEVYFEEHGYGCLIKFHTVLRLGLNLEKGSLLDNMVST